MVEIEGGERLSKSSEICQKIVEMREMEKDVEGCMWYR